MLADLIKQAATKKVAAWGQEPEEESHWLRNSLMAGAVGVPGVTAMTNHRAPIHTPGYSTDNFDIVKANLQTGDILLSGSDEGNNVRNTVAAVQGDPRYTHANLGWGKDKVMDLAPDRQDLVNNLDTSGITPERRVRILRKKSPAAQGIAEGSSAHDFLNKLHGPYGDAPVYSDPKGLKAGLREVLVPDPVAKLWGKITGQGKQTGSELGDRIRCEGGLCTAIPGGTMSADSVARTNKSLDTMLPRDIASDPSLETVLEYTPNAEDMKGRMVRDAMANGSTRVDAIASVEKQLAKRVRRDALLKHAPNIARAGIGLGGAGAVYGMSKLNPENMSPMEMAAGAGLVGAGALPFLSKPLTRAAQADYTAQTRKYMQGRLEALVANGNTPEEAMELYRADMEDLGRKIIKDRGITHVDPNTGMDLVSDLNHPMSRGKASPVYDAKSGRVAANTPEFLAHELGHAADFEGRMRPNAGLVDGEGYRNMIVKHLRERPGKDTLRGAGKTLWDETVANANAVRDMTKHRGWKEGLRTVRNVAPAYSTYILDALRHLKAPGAAAAAGGLGLLGHGMVSNKPDPTWWDSLKEQL